MHKARKEQERARSRDRPRESLYWAKEVTLHNVFAWTAVLCCMYAKHAEPNPPSQHALTMSVVCFLCKWLSVPAVHFHTSLQHPCKPDDLYAGARTVAADAPDIPWAFGADKLQKARRRARSMRQRDNIACMPSGLAHIEFDKALGIAGKGSCGLCAFAPPAAPHKLLMC